MTATDVASGWISLYALLNKAHKGAFQSLTDIKNSVPLPVWEFHGILRVPDDNGSECVNSATEIWCEKEGVPFTRSRDHKQNDNCFFEQKKLSGYDRLESLEEQTLLAAVSKPPVPLLNFFMPTQKLKSKTRTGSKEARVYDEPRSPFIRLSETAGLTQEYKDTLKAQCALYNPVELQQNVNKAILRLRQRLAQSKRIMTQEQE